MGGACDFEHEDCAEENSPAAPLITHSAPPKSGGLHSFWAFLSMDTTDNNCIPWEGQRRVVQGLPQPKVQGGREGLMCVMGAVIWFSS